MTNNRLIVSLLLSGILGILLNNYAFLHDLIGGTVTGLLKGLHNVADDSTTVEVEVRRT